MPRWTLHPARGPVEHVTTLNVNPAAAVRRLADGLQPPLPSVALAAHSKVVGAPSGEPEVVTGYPAEPHGRALPCALTIKARAWRRLAAAWAQVLGLRQDQIGRYDTSSTWAARRSRR